MKLFNKLKDGVSKSVGEGAAKRAVEKASPVLQEELGKALKLGAKTIQDDEKYKKMVVKPALLSLAASSGGVTKLIPGFDEKFTKAMLQARDELLVFNGDEVTLADGFEKKLPGIIEDSLAT
jgi:hypothetical protein